MGYHLPKTSKKIACPGCKRKSFKPYVDDDGKIIDEYQYGRCERINECGYHMKPDGVLTKSESKTLVFDIIYPSEDLLKEFHETPSNLHKALAAKGIPHQFLYDNGVYSKGDLTVFVFRDVTGKLCNVKYFKYKPDGKRDHSFQSFSLKQPIQKNEYIETKYTMPLFGEHELVANPEKIACIVESEKSKIIAMFHYPEFVWLASGSANGLSDGSDGTANKILPIKERITYWVNDNDEAARGKFVEDDKGKQIYRECSSVRNGKKHIKDFHICDLFRDKSDGYDIGDALLDGLKPEIKPTWSPAFQDKRYKSYLQPLTFKTEQEYQASIQYGESSGISEEFDKTYSYMRTHVNGIYGWPGDGKGLMTDFLSVVKAKKDGWKTCMFKEEDLGSYDGEVSAERIYDKLVWTLTGMTPWEKYAQINKCPLLPWDKYNEAKEWVKKHFFVVSMEDRKYTNILETFKFYYEVYGVDQFIIDPWIAVVLDEMERGDERLVKAFLKCKRFVQETNTVMNIISHAGSRHEVKEKSGMFKVVNQFMQLGGSAWDIKMDGQFSYHRPYRHKNPNDPRVHVYNLKQRDGELVGARKSTYKKVEFDVNKRQYYFDGINPIDGSKKEPIKEDQQTEIGYIPSWKQGKKKPKASFEEHLQNDWKDTDEAPF